MIKELITVEDVLADEDFTAWYFKTSEKGDADWEQWITANPQARPVVQEAITFLKELYATEKEVPKEQADAAFARLHNALDKEHNNELPTLGKRNKWWLPAVAACVLLLAGYIIFSHGSEEKKTKLDSNYGQISQYHLPDGSEVLLNAHSELTLKKKWKEGADREVWVKGEAFFHVQKTAAKNKFVVHAKGVDIVVTGTQFNVVNTDKETSVLLTEGSVTLITSEGKEIKMKPGDFVSIVKNNPEKKPVNEEKILAWKQKMLSFDSTRIEEVAAIIKQHYGVTVSVADDVKGEIVSGMMPNNNLDVLLKSLEYTNEFKITRTGEAILISSPQ